jgi:hypothetical protein
MLDFVTSSSSIRTIVLSFRGPLNMSGEGFGASEAGDAPKQISWSGAPSKASQAQVFASALQNTFTRLAASGKSVILFMDWPELGFDPKSCLPRPVRLFSSDRRFCGVPRSQVDNRNRAYRDLIVRTQEELSNIKVFDPLPYLCDASACYAMNDGHLLYRDDHHLSLAGAAYLSANFLKVQSYATSAARKSVEKP